MADDLVASLDLDYSEAIAGADSLADAIESAMQAGASSGAGAIVDELNGIDPGSLDVPITADVASIIDEINAIDPGEIEVPITADASGIVDEINSIEPGQIEVPVAADTAAAAEDIAGLDNVTVSIAVEADTSDAQADLDALAGSAEEASSSLGKAGGASGEAAGGFGAAGESAGLAAGGLSKVGGASLSAAAGIGAATFGFAELFREGVTAATGTERLSQAAGTLASSVQQIHVGNLNTDLKTLGNEFGSTGAEMDAAAAKAINFATAGGYSAQQSVTFAQSVAALSARAVALNPSLGNVADVADQMSTSFGRVILAAKKYNLSLSTAEVAQRAMANTGKTAANQLTIQDKAFAAVQISSERYGNTLAEKIANGSELAANKQKSLIATGKELAETLGRPLAEGAIAGLSQLQGPIEGAIKGFSALPGPVQTAAAALIAFGIAEQLLGKEGAIAGTRNLLASIGDNMRPIGGLAAAAGVGIALMGAQSENAAQTIAGLAVAGAGLGTVVLPGLGTAVGAAAGAVAGFAVVGLGFGSTTDRMDAAQKHLNNTVTTGSIPAIINATDAFFRAADATGKTEKAQYQAQAAFNQGSNSLANLKNAYQQTNVPAEKARAITEAFNTSLRKSPEAALTTIAAFDRLGINTELYSDKLTASVRASQLAQQATAQLGAAASPLKVTFEQASTAVGGLTDRQFQVAAAGSQALDSISKLGPAQDKFTAALEEGNASGIEAAANAKATAEAQNVYNSTLLATGSATQAATAASGTFRAQLGEMLNAIPADNPAHAAIEAIITQMDNLTQHPASIDLKVEGGAAALQLASINKAIDDIIEHPKKDPVKIFMDDTEATAKLDGINQARQILTRDPTQFQVVMQDLATGNIDHLNQLLADVERQRQVHVSAETEEARTNVADLQGKIDNTKGTVHVLGDATGAHKATEDAKVHADGTTGKITIDGSPELAKGAVEGAKVYADSTTGKITIGGDAAPAGSVIVGTVNQANTSTGTITVDANAGAAQQKTQQVVTFADGSIGVVTLDANPNPANGQISGVVNFADGSTGTVTVDGNADPATGKVNATITYADGSTGTIQVNGNPAGAYSAVASGVERANSSHGDIGIGGREEFKRGDYGTIGNAVINIGLSGTGALFVGKAGGGTIPYGGGAAGGASFADLSVVTVGERGPENVLLPGGSFVENNPRTRARNQRDGGGGGTTEVTVDASALDEAANRLLGAAELLIAVTGLGDPPSRRILQARA